MQKRRREHLMARIGTEVVRFQEESSTFDDLAARVLGIDRVDLPCMTLLLYGGPSTVEKLQADLHSRRASVTGTIDRLQLAGYARRRSDGDHTVIELTQHARQWIERIWSPLRDQGDRLMRSYSLRDLGVIGGFMVKARRIHEREVRDIRKWLEAPSSTARKSHLRGGLSPAAVRRVQVFVEGNLDRTIRIADLAARAGLSIFHFARAFKASAGITPRAFVEQRRLERARHLINESDQSLAAIAVASGFGTQSRLTSTFKRRTGFTPGEYRRGRTGGRR